MDDERKVGDRSFQTRDPETAKLCDPYVIVLVLGTTIRPPRADNDGQCWQQPEHTFLSEKMELPRPRSIDHAPLAELQRSTILDFYVSSKQDCSRPVYTYIQLKFDTAVLTKLDAGM